MQQVLRQIQEAVEPVLERSLTKRRRQEFLASAGPLFLCLTFIEDALRVLLRWKEQMSYMTVTMRMRAPPLPSEPQRISLGPRASHAPLAAAAQERLAGWTPAHLFARDAGACTAAPGRTVRERETRDASACRGWSGPPPPLARLQPALAGVADAGHSQAAARVCSRGAHP